MAITGKRTHVILLGDREASCRKRVKLDSHKFIPDYSSQDNLDGDHHDTGYSSVDSFALPNRKSQIRFPDPATLAQLVVHSASGEDNSNASRANLSNSATEQGSELSPNPFTDQDGISNYLTVSASRTLSRHNSSSVPKSDLIARERCFDYIVQSIDEVWARYCDTTSSAENQLYPYGCASPVSDFYASGNESDSGYKSCTDVETDSDYRKVSNLPGSVELESLKNRLTKAKCDLEQTVDSAAFSECVAFWNRWDMIKYNAVEMMEEDDDDELVESVIEELEQGRCYNES